MTEFEWPLEELAHTVMSGGVRKLYDEEIDRVIKYAYAGSALMSKARAEKERRRLLNAKTAEIVRAGRGCGKCGGM
jgi:hypothetical protein